MGEGDRPRAWPARHRKDSDGGKHQAGATARRLAPASRRGGGDDRDRRRARSGADRLTAPVRTSIRLKLAAALASPLVALAAFGLVEVRDTTTRVAEVRRQADMARAVIGPAGLITTLQNERTWPAVELVGAQAQIDATVADYGETRRQTDAAIEAFRESIADEGPVVAEAFGPALDQLDELDAIRADIDAFTGPRQPVEGSVAFASTVFDRYSVLIEPFFDATTTVSLEVDADDELRQGTELADASARLIEAMSRLLHRTITTGLLSPGGLDLPQEIVEVSTLQHRYDMQVDIVRGGTGRYAALADELFPDELDAQITAAVDDAVATGAIDLDALVPEGSVVPYQDAVREAITERADELDAQAGRQRLTVAAAVLLLLVVVAALTWAVARSLTRPLRRLTRQARDVAGRTLPEAVHQILATPLGEDVAVPPPAPVDDIGGDDDVGHVARALVTAQDAALGLAVEQAVLRRHIADAFVSLARRNQNLLATQIGLITQLESHEVDPEALSSLFHLDHLATRMRRNAESLLVLAGLDPPRYRAEPAPVLDVVRAAVGEVEDYERAVLGEVQPGFVAGAVTSDLAHVIAELLENALAFSPPSRHVVIHGRSQPDGTYRIAIVDGGMGMEPAALEQANRRLQGGEVYTVAPSRYLGHYVAGRLAARHGLRLWLEPSPGSGVTAVVELPASVLQPQPRSPAPAAGVFSMTRS